MADSTPVIGILALVVLAVAVLVIVPAGPGPTLIPEQTDHQQTWDEYQVDNPSLDFSAGFGLLVLNLALMLAFISYSFFTYRNPDEEEPWRELSYYEDDE
ncbi:hypothetical protein [Halobacteriaceae bacterium SHR40]|uniref:hypothetical protein n=1 Tax=Halovenus amylolytica TaxID=2500550 RepID=UPI000FE312CF